MLKLSTPFKTGLSILFCHVSIILAAQDSINITFNPSTPGLAIPDNFAGLAFEKNSLIRGYFAPGKDTLVQLFKTLGVHIVRVGGDSVDKDTLGSQSTGTSYTTAEIDSEFGFFQQANCKVIMGLNIGQDFNPSQQTIEASYMLQNYAPSIAAFEIGNEPDLYTLNGYRTTYTVTDYEGQFMQYLDSIRTYYPSASFTGPATFYDVPGFTVPFCAAMSPNLAMITHHYYVGAAGAGTIQQQTGALLSPAAISTVTTEVDSIVECTNAAGIPLRIAETNSFFNGGQWGVSDAFASALWVLDYMYNVARHGCAGVNVHGSLSGPYTVIAYDSIYHARPIYYGILAFQMGSRGSFVPAQVTNDSINLDVFGVVDSAKNLFVTVINKDTTGSAVLNINAGSIIYPTASYTSLTAPSVTDTSIVTLGGQSVLADGSFASPVWQTLSDTLNKVSVTIPPATAYIIRFIADTAAVDTTVGIYSVTAVNANYLKLYPNPAGNQITIETNQSLPYKIQLIDVLGSEVEELTGVSSKTTFNTSLLNQGTYFVRTLFADGTVLNSRFIKE